MLITCNPTPITRTGGFTVAMFEILTKLVCLIWKFSRGGWRTTFLPDNTEWRTNGYRLCLSIKNAHFKEFWILISQYNNSLRAPWERYAKNWTNIKKWNKRIMNWTAIITINQEFDSSLYKVLFCSHFKNHQVAFSFVKIFTSNQRNLSS